MESTCVVFGLDVSDGVKLGKADKCVRLLELGKVDEHVRLVCGTTCCRAWLCAVNEVVVEG